MMLQKARTSSMVENQMCHDITTDKFDFELQTYQPKEYKSKII